MEKELWVNVIDYEGIYMISNRGRVKNILKNRILKGFYNKKGYISVKLYKTSCKKTFFIHRLVALHFIENNENKPQVNHINGIKTDNKVENLEWCTNSENMNHRYTYNKKEKYKLHYDKKRCKWESYINYKGKKIHLGRFDLKEDALNAFKKKYIEIHNIEPWK